MLLGQAPQSKIEIYYAFLPEIAFAMFNQGNRQISDASFVELVNNFAERKGIDAEDLNNVKNNLLSLEMLLKDGDGFKFKHNYTYYYFLGQYFSDRMSTPAIHDQVSEICKNLNIKENANIIVFLSYMFIFNLIKATSKFTGAENLSKTYKDALDVRSETVHKILDLSIKMDCFEQFPMQELKNLMGECANNHLAMATVQSLVKYRLYMRPLDEFKQKQQICSTVGIT